MSNNDPKDPQGTAQQVHGGQPGYPQQQQQPQQYPPQGAQGPQSGQYGQGPQSGQYGQGPQSGQYQQNYPQQPPSGQYGQNYGYPGTASGQFQQNQQQGPQSGQYGQTYPHQQQYPSGQMPQGGYAPPSTGPNQPQTGVHGGPGGKEIVRLSLPQPGELVAGRFHIIRELGKGGFGAVYHAKQVGIDKEVALKILLPSASSMEGASERFRREAMLSKELSHPNTITINDYGQTEDGLTFIAMEYLEGRTLEDEIRANGAMEPERVRHITSQILKSLAEAHARGIVHRDLKPANIMLVEVFGESDFVKVLDFGIARAFEDNAEDYKTKTGTVIGTPQYMSPEQLKGGEIGPQSDIYSLGLIVAEMLCGYVIYANENTNLIIVAQLSDPMCPIPAIVTQSSLGNAVYRSVLKEPTQRFQTSQEMLQSLKEPAPAPGVEASGAEAKTMMQQSPFAAGADLAPERKSKLPLILLLVLLLAGAGVGVMFAMTGGEEPEPTAGSDDPTQTPDGPQANLNNGPDTPDPNANNGNGAVTPPVASHTPEQEAAMSRGTQLGNGTFRNATLILAADAAAQAAQVGTIRFVLLTDPLGVEVHRAGTMIGRTPVSAEVRAGVGAEFIRLHKDGFDDQLISVDMSNDAFLDEITMVALDQPERSATRTPRERRQSSGTTTTPRETPREQTTTPPENPGGIQLIDTPSDSSERERRRRERRERQRRQRQRTGTEDNSGSSSDEIVPIL